MPLLIVPILFCSSSSCALSAAFSGRPKYSASFFTSESSLSGVAVPEPPDAGAGGTIGEGDAATAGGATTGEGGAGAFTGYFFLNSSPAAIMAPKSPPSPAFATPSKSPNIPFGIVPSGTPISVTFEITSSPDLFACCVLDVEGP